MPKLIADEQKIDKLIFYYLTIFLPGFVIVASLIIIHPP